MAGEGRGRDLQVDGQELRAASANPNDKKYDKYDKKYNKYNEVVLGNLTAKGIGGCANLLHAHTPQATIGACMRDNNTRAPRV